MSDRCDDVLNENGSSYRCELERGHTGAHENGSWEWITEIARTTPENRNAKGLTIWPYWDFHFPLCSHVALVRCSKCPQILVKLRSNATIAVLSICSRCILTMGVPQLPEEMLELLIKRARHHARQMAIMGN